MTEQFSSHKLTAILYANVAGYSRLTSQDEMGIHKRVMEVLDYASESIKQALPITHEPGRKQFFGGLLKAGVPE